MIFRAHEIIFAAAELLFRAHEIVYFSCKSDTRWDGSHPVMV